MKTINLSITSAKPYLDEANIEGKTMRSTRGTQSAKTEIPRRSAYTEHQFRADFQHNVDSNLITLPTGLMFGSDGLFGKYFTCTSGQYRKYYCSSMFYVDIVFRRFISYSISKYRDQTWFSIHSHSQGPEGGVENRGRSPRFSTSPEGPGECESMTKSCLTAIIA